jgi:putative aldouronate transport system substrate-binding protein
LQPPKTMDEYVNIVRTFVKNGKPGTVGMALQKDLFGATYAVLDGFFNGYHAYPNTWIEKDGKMAYGSIQPEMKKPLQVLADMYKEGLLDKEFAVKDGNKESEITVSGMNGAFFGAHWTGLWPLQLERNNDPKSDWRAYPIVSADDKTAMTQSIVGTGDWFCMSKKCKYPEAVMKLFNLYVDKTFDPVDQEYVKYSNPPGTEGVWRLSPVITYLATKNLDNYRNIQDPLKTGDSSKLFGEQLAMYENCKKFKDGDESMWGWDKTFGPNSTWNVTNQYHKDDRILVSGYAGAPTPTMVEKKTTLDKMQKELIIKIIMGQESVDAFDKFCTDWLALGGQAMTDEVNAALGK